ncbi:hypothetical protein JZ751_022550 [Albula glossodonta]|uniref:NudC domain-containing protein 2 n=1 Tax=Albula glossodonta TaxID=121402 RepID=A0A8T2PHV2_9TELE|nr:hypothetical protein JZ751_022550 [Albula glossodonta]
MGDTLLTGSILHPAQSYGQYFVVATPGTGTGKLFGMTVADEGTWTLEDKKLIRIVLMKTNREAGNCWQSLLEGEYCANPWVQDQMQRKLTLERFQRENPGFDFSGAEISGNFAGGGPDFSNLK